MKLTEALDYMKVIISNAKERGNSINNVRKGLNEYLEALVSEGVITAGDCRILNGVVKRVNAIMDDEITVDKAFARALRRTKHSGYVKITSTKQPKVQNKNKNNNSKKHKKEKNKIEQEDNTINVTDASPVIYSNPWDDFPIEPDGSCGRFDNYRRQKAYEEYMERMYGNGINQKCRN